MKMINFNHVRIVSLLGQIEDSFFQKLGQNVIQLLLNSVFELRLIYMVEIITTILHDHNVT